MGIEVFKKNGNINTSSFKEFSGLGNNNTKLASYNSLMINSQQTDTGYTETMDFDNLEKDTTNYKHITASGSSATRPNTSSLSMVNVMQTDTGNTHKIDFDASENKIDNSSNHINKLTNYDMTDTRSPSELSTYVKYLYDNELIELNNETYQEILTYSYDEALEIVNYMAAETKLYREQYYKSVYGMEITDELSNILSLPKDSRESKLNEYIDNYFSSTENIDNYIALMETKGLLFTDEDKDIIRTLGTNDLTNTEYLLAKTPNKEKMLYFMANFEGNQDSSIERINNYLGTIYMESTFRYIATNQAYTEFETRCRTLTGYTPTEIFSGEPENQLNKELAVINNEIASTSNEEELASLQLKKAKINEEIKKISDFKSEINNRIQFLVDDMELESSGKLDDIALYDDFNADRFQIWGGGTGARILKITDNYLIWKDGDGNWKKKYADEGNESLQVLMDGKPIEDLYFESCNILALARYLSDNKNTEEVKTIARGIELCQPVDAEIFWNPTANDTTFRDLVEIMSETEIKKYNYYYHNEGWKAAQNYLENLVKGKDFQEKLISHYVINEIKKVATVNQYIAWSELEEVFVDENGNLIFDPNEKITDGSNILTRLDENGNIHYYKGKENTMYYSTVEKGKVVYYEIVPNDNDFVNKVKFLKDGFSDGFINFFGGIVKFFSESDGEYSVDESIKNQYVSMISELYDYSKNIYGVGSSIGNAAPAMIISFIPGVGQATSMAATWMSNVGNTKDQAVNQGYSLEQAMKYALASGSMDTVITVFTKSIPGIGKTLGKFDNGLSKYFLYTVLKSGAGASLGYVEDLLLRDWILDEDFSKNFSWSDMKDQATTSMWVTGILNAYKIPKDITFVKNMVETKNSTVTGLMNDNNLTKKQARKAYALSEIKGIDLTLATNIVRMMDENNMTQKEAIKVSSIMSMGYSQEQAIDMSNRVLDKKLTPEETVAIFNIKTNYNLSEDDALKIYNTMQNEGIDIDGAINVYKIMQSGNISESDAIRLNSVSQKKLLKYIDQGYSYEQILNYCEKYEVDLHMLLNENRNLSGSPTMLDSIIEYESLISSELSESQVLDVMLDNFATKNANSWCSKDSIVQTIEDGYNNARKYDNISREDYLKIKLQLIPPNDIQYFPNLYADLEQQMNDSNYCGIYYGETSLIRLLATDNNVQDGSVTFNFGNGIGRGATENDYSAQFAIPEASLDKSIPDNFDSLSLKEQAKILAKNIGLYEGDFVDGIYKIEIDKSVYGDNWYASNAYAQGSNQLYIPGTILPNNDATIHEVIIPRTEGIISYISSDYQVKIENSITAGNKDTAISYFFEGIANGQIKLRDGVHIKKVSN